MAGYRVADYLNQHASRERGYARVPASTWNAVLDHTPDPADAARLANSARDRLLYGYAIPLYRHAADAGDGDAGKALAELLAGRGDLEELRARADAGDMAAAEQVAWLPASRGDLKGVRARTSLSARRLLNLTGWAFAGTLASCGELDVPRRQDRLRGQDGTVQILRARADAGERGAAEQLAELLTGLVTMMVGWDLKELRAHLEEVRVRALAGLAGLGDAQELSAWDLDTLRACDLDGLRARAGAGDGYAAWALAGLLADRGDLEELRARADAGDRAAAEQLARLLADHGDLEELSARANAGDQLAAGLLADLLARHGDLDRAVQMLRARADVGDRAAAERLAGLLADRGDLDTDPPGELLTLALRGLLADRGDLEELRAGADAGDRAAAEQLARLLADRGDLEELSARADAGDMAAAEQVARLLADRGDLDRAVQILRARAVAELDELLTLALQGVLAHCGDLDGLRARADAGNGDAAELLANLLADRGDLDGAVQILRARADAGDRAAADQLACLLAGLLAGLLADRGDLEELCARADVGDRAAAERLADLLADRGDLDALRAGADVGDRAAAERLADLLADRGDLEELSAGADTGYQFIAGRLNVLLVALAVIGDLDGLRARAGPATSLPPGGWPICWPGTGI